MNQELKLVFPKKIEKITKLWTQKSKISLILSTVLLIIFISIITIYAVIFINAFYLYLNSLNIFILIITLISVFSFFLIFAIVTNGIFSYRSYKSKELNKSFLLISINQIILFFMIILNIAILFYTFMLIVNIMANFTPSTVINIKIFGTIHFNQAMAILHANFALIIILLLLLASYFGFMVYYLAKYHFYKRIVWNNYHSNYQWLDGKYIDTKYRKK